MKRPIFTFVLAACAGTGVIHAQSTSASGQVVQPTSPAPVVVTTSAPETSAPAVVQAPANTAPTDVTQIVYTPQLPSAADINNAATAQGLTVDRIVQTSNQVIAFYRNASGQTSNVAYQSLPPAGITTPAAAPNVVVTSPPPTVVYQPAPPRVVYYDYPSYYYPRVWYPPVSFSFGLGYRGHYHGGGYYRGGGHYHRR